MSNKYVPIIGILTFSAVLIGLLALLGGDQAASVSLEEIDPAEQVATPLRPEEAKVVAPETTNDMNPIAVLSTNKGDIEVELYTDRMPITAGNFEQLVKEGYFDGIKFHRVIDGFMIQGGDPNTKTDNVNMWGGGGPGYAIQDEHIAGEGLSNTRGTLSMANSGPNSGGSQFFINLVDNSFLDFDKEPLSSKHPVFGRVVKGMDVVDAIAKVDTGARDIPVEPIVIESAVLKEQSSTDDEGADTAE